MRAFLIILLILVVLGFIAFRWGKSVFDKFAFNISFKGVDLQSILNGTGFTQVDLTVSIDNKNNFSVPVTGFYAEIFYNNNLLAKSTNSGQQFVIPANGNVTVSHSVTVGLTNDAIDIAGKLISKQSIPFTYKIKATLWGWIPISYSGKFNY